MLCRVETIVMMSDSGSPQPGVELRAKFPAANSESASYSWPASGALIIASSANCIAPHADIFCQLAHVLQAKNSTPRVLQ